MQEWVELTARDRAAYRDVVFSYFRDVLDTVAAVLGNAAIGPLTGSTPPDQRQDMIDELRDRRGPGSW